ncbi:hypothetical protein MRB53_001830 [Persea americana]|uniref:Uncharacterized protein n=1 Tax=Persea americana TaxID=3435 RepID=A0ACC2MSQ6_PERAE|nr:hypothetical protein MRB53_001830 [Persea americana]
MEVGFLPNGELGVYIGSGLNVSQETQRDLDNQNGKGDSVCSEEDGDQSSVLFGWVVVWGDAIDGLVVDGNEKVTKVVLIMGERLMEIAGVERSDLRVVLRASREKCTG